MGTPHWLKVKGICIAHFSAHIAISFALSLLHVPSVRFPPVTSSPTCSLSKSSASPTSFGGSRQNPCASAHWSGMSGCLANPTPNTGHEPNFYSYMNEEHTPINLPDSHRSFQCRDDATIISATEDPEGFPHSGASSSRKQTTPSRVPTMFGSLGASLWKQWHESVDDRAFRKLVQMWIENRLFDFFQFTVKREKRARSKRRAFVERQRKSPENP